MPRESNTIVLGFARILVDRDVDVPNLNLKSGDEVDSGNLRYGSEKLGALPESMGEWSVSRSGLGMAGEGV